MFVHIGCGDFAHIAHAYFNHPKSPVAQNIVEFLEVQIMNPSFREK